jgi:hypothetical protein
MAERKSWIWKVDNDGNPTDYKYNVKMIVKLEIKERRETRPVPEDKRFLVIAHFSNRDRDTAVVHVNTHDECRKWVNEYFKTR